MFENPYIAGNPVGGSSAFVGRTDVLRAVVTVLNDPNANAIVLYGQRRIGKTSVLRELAWRLPKEGGFHVVYVDLQDKAGQPFTTVLQELAERIALSIEAPMPSLDHDNVKRDFQTVFLPDVLTHLPDDTSLVLLFDEFDVLDNTNEGQAEHPYLRELLTFNPRLQFVFVIGRPPEDLTISLSIFKNIPAHFLSLLTPEDTAAIVRLSAQNSSLQWSAEAERRVYELTGGHPFLTQALCWAIWYKAHSEEPLNVPQVDPGSVDAAVADTMSAAKNALEWLWNGLPPPHRIAASALATAGTKTVTQTELESCLLEGGIRILIGELTNAPDKLVEWDLIQRTEAGYCFRIELLRRWVVDHKPLTRVQEEIDRIHPVAENLFQAGYSLFLAGDLAQALLPLQQSVQLNPAHIRSTQTLSEIYLAQNELDKALQLQERLYEYLPAMARPRLVQILSQVIERETDNEKCIRCCDRILEIDPQNEKVQKRRQDIWFGQLVNFVQSKKFEAASILIAHLDKELNDNHPKYLEFEKYKQLVKVGSFYRDGVEAYDTGNWEHAGRLFGQVVALDSDHKESFYYLAKIYERRMLNKPFLKYLFRHIHHFIQFVDQLSTKQIITTLVIFVIVISILLTVSFLGLPYGIALTFMSTPTATVTPTSSNTPTFTPTLTPTFTPTPLSAVIVPELLLDPPKITLGSTGIAGSRILIKLDGGPEIVVPVSDKGTWSATIFPKVTPGEHVIQIELLDENGTVIGQSESIPFVMPTATSTPTATYTPTYTPTPIPTETPTPIPSKTATATATETATATFTRRPTVTRTQTPTATLTWTLTITPTPTRVPTPTHTPKPEPPAGATTINPIDGAVYVYVPSGEFSMNTGSSAAQDFQAVTVAGFWIMKTEVTNAQYKQCVESTSSQHCTTNPANNRWNDPKYAHHPVTGVTAEQASRYAQWASGQLPTEAEWEKAARGKDDTRTYPWGDNWDGELLNFCDKNCPNGIKDEAEDDGYKETAPVGCYPGGASPYGVLDMVGNVWEWTIRSRSGDNGGYVTRGGSWNNLQDNVQIATRNVYRGNTPDSLTGFRVVRSVFEFPYEQASEVATYEIHCQPD